MIKKAVKLRDRFTRGQTMVVMTMVIGVLLGAMALGTDVGLFYYNWMLLQKAADSAAIAGAPRSPHWPIHQVMSRRPPSALRKGTPV